MLGDDHDLAVLTEQLRAEPDAFGGEAVVRPALEFIGNVREDLQRRARRLGPRLYVEAPNVFAERLAGCWAAWHEHGDELEAGEISDLWSSDDDLDERSVRQPYGIAPGPADLRPVGVGRRRADRVDPRRQLDGGPDRHARPSMPPAWPGRYQPCPGSKARPGSGASSRRTVPSIRP